MSKHGSPIVGDVDLTSCEREPITIPGLIQPHGVMLVLVGTDLIVRQVSANAGEVLGIPLSGLLDRPIGEVFGPGQSTQLRMASLAEDPTRFNPMRLSLPAGDRGRSFEGILHRVDGDLIVELEPICDAIGESSAIFHAVQEAMAKLQTAGSLKVLYQTAADEARRVTGFDRVMVYRFDAEWSGEVVAESRAGALASTYLGLRFPASDIPEQARRLYETNLVRVIPDVGYAPAGLMSGEDPTTGRDLNMSRCVLRSVSPMHIEYLVNMGVSATLTISVLRDGKLWGLIACHHDRPRFISHERRLTCEFLGQLFAAQMSVREEGEDRAYRLGSATMQANLLEQLARASPPIWGLISGRPNLLDFIESQGAAIVREGECRRIGQTPGDPEILQLVEWLSREIDQEVYATDALPAAYPPAASYKGVASGVLALEISRRRREYVLWFRPERVQVVSWAGDPGKLVVVEDESGSARLHPRKSFELWKQTVAMQSEPWRPREVDVVSQLRSTILGVIGSKEQLHSRACRQAAIAELGQRALACTDLDFLFHDAIDLVSRTLDVQANIHRQPRVGDGRSEPGTSRSASCDCGMTRGSAAAPALRASRSTAGSCAAITEERDESPRSNPLPFAEDREVASRIAVPLVDSGHELGVLIASSSLARTFDREEVHFLELVANMLVTAVRRRRVEQDMEHQSLHDGLTGLPNRTLLMARLTRGIDSALGGHAPLALMLLDLDRFKEINDTYGHHYGDELLRQASDRFRAVVGDSGTVARLGGDEFAILLPATGKEGAERVAAEILAELSRAFTLEGGERCEVGCSIGIALHPEHGSDGISLMRLADVAMYTAKRSGGGSSLYIPALDHYSPSRLALVGELRRAIEEDELILHYQPKIDLRSRRFIGTEALIRWRHPQHGLLPPGEFIPMAEQTGLITPLGDWALRQAIAQCRRWRDAGVELGVAVNVSPYSLHGGQLIGIVDGLLASSTVPASFLTLEITEGALMQDPAGSIEVLHQIRDEMGVRISIDDFGTGYSSLAYLKRLPVDEVKIDRAFVKDMAADRKDASIVRSVIDLGHNLGLQVVAEGVEDAETLEQLAAMGCDQAQGYYLSRPVTAADLTLRIDLGSN